MTGVPCHTPLPSTQHTPAPPHKTLPHKRARVMLDANRMYFKPSSTSMQFCLQASVSAQLRNRGPRQCLNANGPLRESLSQMSILKSCTSHHIMRDSDSSLLLCSSLCIPHSSNHQIRQCHWARQAHLLNCAPHLPRLRVWLTVLQSEPYRNK